MIPVTTSTLGDIGKVCMCKRIMKEQTSPVGDIPFYKISTFGDKADCYISREVYEDYKTRFSFPKKGDILISAAGTLGRTVIYDGEDAFFQDSNIVWIDNDESKVLNEYLYYFYMTNPWVKTFGSTIPRLYNDNIRSVSITYPTDIEDQKNVVRIMKTIDSKIANNNAICSNLEAMAKLLYDYWFVQFDFPDENGKPYKSSGGKMVWNDELKREIPAGWEAKPLSAFIADSKNGDWGSDKPKRKDDIEVTCFRGADFASITDDYHVTAPIRYISANNSDRLLSDGDLVTEISGGSPTQATGRVGYINQKFLDRNGGKMDCSNFCKAFTPMKCFYQYWLYQTWKAFYDAGVMFNYESKTTGIKNLMFDEFITWVRVPAPSDELLKKYQEVCSQYYDKIQEEFIESTQLASLRDFLLPMLMNGQVKVGKVGA